MKQLRRHRSHRMIEPAPGIFINRKGRSFDALPSQPEPRVPLGASVPWDNGRGKRYWFVAASHQLTRPNRSTAVYFFNGTSTQLELQLEIGSEGIATLCVADVDMDGDQDLFIGSTSPYKRYPEPVSKSRMESTFCKSWLYMQLYFLTLREMVDRIWHLQPNGDL